MLSWTPPLQHASQRLARGIATGATLLLLVLASTGLQTASAASQTRDFGVTVIVNLPTACRSRALVVFCNQGGPGPGAPALFQGGGYRLFEIEPVGVLSWRPDDRVSQPFRPIGATRSSQQIEIGGVEYLEVLLSW